MFKDPIKVKLVVTEIANTDFKKLQQSIVRPFLVGLNLSPKLGNEKKIEFQFNNILRFISFWIVNWSLDD